MIRPASAAFLAGAVVMALEILASRWMAPGFGFTLTTWACLISVTLLAGALGAAWGGRLSRAASWSRVAVLLSGAGACCALLGFVAPSIVDGLSATSLTWGAAAAAGVILIPAVLLLSAVLPLVVALVRREAEAGATVGRLVAASTVGSLVGTLGAAFGIVPHMGLLAGSLFLGALLAAGALFLLRRRTAGAGALLLGALTAGFVPAAPSDAEFSEHTPYGLLTLEPADAGGWRLAIDGISQASISPLVVGPGALIGRRVYFELLPFLHPLGRRALNVGLGGGLVPACLEAYDIDVETIEVNESIVRLMRERFGFEGTVHVGDGRAVWRSLSGPYDFVILDAFQGESLPGHLLTREALAELKQRMASGGVLCVHLIGRPAHAVTRLVHATLQAEFTHTWCVRSGLGDELQDLYLFASAAPLVLPPQPELAAAGWLGNEVFSPGSGSAAAITDDLNPLDVANADLGHALRRASRR